MTQKPNVLIFGGCNGLGPQLALYLVPLTGEPLVSHLRMVDKFSVSPPTTYIGKDFPNLLRERKDLVEYRQANLTVPETVVKCFTDPSPNGLPYTHIFDVTGERYFDRPAAIHISQTFNISLLIARTAAAQTTPQGTPSVKAYIRSLYAFYDHVTEKKRYTEDDSEGWRPVGVNGVWWHEMIRAVASVPGLPLVVCRTAYGYGPGVTYSVLTTTMLLGLVYASLGEEMRFLWGPKLKKNTIHTHDILSIGWRAAEWAASLDRESMDEVAGVVLPPSGGEVGGVEGVVGNDREVRAPVFNLVDDGDSNQGNIAETIAKVFGIKCGFQGSLASKLAKFKFETVAEDVNEMHMAEWTNIIGNLADPPVPDTPLSPYAHPFQLEKQGCALDGEKVKRILGYKLAYPQFDVDSVKETIESYRAEGIWPETNKYPPS